MTGPRNAIGVVGKNGSTAVPVTGTQDTRMGLSALLKRQTGMQAHSGIVHGPAGSILTVAGTSGWTYTVTPGAAVIANDANAGAYVVPSDVSVTVTTSAAPATGSRIDLIYLVQNDAWDRVAASTGAAIGVVVGTSVASGTPTTPTLPDNALLLARNLMTSAATSTASAGNTITQNGIYTVAAGGVNFYPTLTQLTADATRAEGELGYASDYQHWYGRIPGGFDARLAFTTDVTTSVANQAERDATYGSPTTGAAVYRRDLMRTERYYGLYNATSNPRGAAVAGWYPEGTIRAYVYEGGYQSGNTGSLALLQTGYASDPSSAPEIIAGASLSTGRYTLPWAGIYNITAEVTWQSGGNVSGQRNIIVDSGSSCTLLAGGGVGIESPTSFVPHVQRISRSVRVNSVDANAWVRPATAHNDGSTLKFDMLTVIEYVGPTPGASTTPAGA